MVSETEKTLGDILGEALQSVRSPGGTPNGSLGDILGAALRTATDQPSTHLVTGAKQVAPSTENRTSIDQRLAKLRRKLGGKP
jgi:hypothetical protein